VDIDGTITKSDVRGLMATQIKDTAAFLGNALSGANSRASELILSTAQAADYTHEGVANVRRCLALTVSRLKDSELGNRGAL